MAAAADDAGGLDAGEFLGLVIRVLHREFARDDEYGVGIVVIDELKLVPLMGKARVVWILASSLRCVYHAALRKSPANASRIRREVRLELSVMPRTFVLPFETAVHAIVQAMRKMKTAAHAARNSRGPRSKPIRSEPFIDAPSSPKSISMIRSSDNDIGTPAVALYAL
ncbi:MAG: hypothetical protein LLG08_08590 [Actinomycetia bacterium]|nr:hypothetical protein [Actinomycetes bacterium]